MSYQGNGHSGNGRERLPGRDVSDSYQFPASAKVHLSGSIHPDVRVPMREIALSPTRALNGILTQNGSVRVYDTSGPYTDQNAAIDLHAGLPRLRESWIRNRVGATY